MAALCVGGLVWAFHADFPADGWLFLYALPVIGAAAYLGGRIPGGVAGIFSLLAARYFIVSPAYSFSLFPAILPVLGLFALLSAFVVEASVRLRDADIAARKLASIVESSDDAIFSETVDGTILTWNAGAERLYGYAPAEVIGRSVSMLAPPEHADEIAGILTRLRRGERVERHESVRLKKDGTRFDVSLTISAIRTASGMIAGASVIARDISDRKRIERQQQVLTEASEALARSLEVDANLETLAGLLVAELADWCIIDLVGDDGTLRTAITKHRDPARMALMREVQRQYPPDLRSGYGSANAVRTGRAEVYPDVSDALLEEAMPNAALRSIMRNLGSRSAMVVPLTARERAFGAITLFSAESARRYTGSDLVFAEELARRAALALDNARLHRSEQLQRAAAQRAVDRIGRMQAVTAALSEAVTPEQVADVIVTHALQTLGGTAAGLFLIGPDGSTAELVRAVGYPPEITQRSRRLSLEQHPVLAAAIRTRRVAWRDPDDDADAPEHEGIPEAFRRDARASIPMMLHGRAIGVLSMNFRDRHSPGADDLESMLTLGWQCGQAVERARLYAREHRVAETLQRAFLPGVLPQLPGIAVHAAYRSGGVRESDIGGDWYDVFRLPNGHLALSIGDVAGRGLRAAVTMGQLRQSIRAAALEHTDPSIVLKHVSDLLALTDGDDTMATALFGVLDPNTCVLAYATAGHPAPILVGHDLEPARLGCGGLPLGYLGDEPLPLQTVELPAGSLLVVYTDGLVETRYDPIVGEAAVIEAARRELAEATSDHAEGIVRRVLTHEPIRDDIAVITLAVAGTRLDRFEITLPAEPRNAVLIRQALRRLALDAGLDPDRLASVTVAVGEAVNNVIEHAYGAKTGPVRVRARLDGSVLRIDVADEGTWRPVRPADGGGHGLHVMKALVDVVEVDTTPAGTTVRLAVKLPDDRGPGRRAPSTADGSIPAAPLAVSGAPLAAVGPPRGVTALPPGHPVALKISQIDGIPVVTVAGDLDLENTDAFAATLDRAARAESGTVIVSLGDATYLDSHAVGTLFRFGRRLTTNRRKLLVVAPSSGALRRIVDIAGMQAVLRIFDSLAEAARSALPTIDAS
ncbi:MAG TPA: SpoIIE family protein phosphatase [bacterium]|nr:SpoIIE family protein phosphatase [bacterium]